MTLLEFFRQHPRAALAFSGGVDSAYLLHAGRAAGADIKPYFVQTPFQPSSELMDARRLAPDLMVLELDILQDQSIANNPENRCYHCKKSMLSHLKNQALADGYPLLLDGTNASDPWDDRPGMKALEELGVLSPLRLCGLTKEEIRALSREAGLFTWNKPSYACLATRIPAGTAIDRQTLERIEAAEAALSRLGYRDFRVRIFHDAARIQLIPQQFPTSISEYRHLQDALRPYFKDLLLDLQGRRKE